MRHWEFKYFEKNIKDSHSYIFKSLEIKNYIQKFLKDCGKDYGLKLMLHSYRFNFSNSTIHLFVSIFEEQKVDQKKLKQIMDQKELETKKRLPKLVTKLIVNPPKTTLQQIKNDYAVTYKLIKLNLNQELKFNNVKNHKSDNVSKKLLESLSLFTQNKFNIVLTLQNINITLNRNKKLLSRIKIKLQRFKKSDFFKRGTKILFAFVTQNNSEKLLTNFISKELQITKRHNFFLSFLKESLALMLDQKFSKILGVKLIVKGRLNNGMRSKTKKITIGKISLIQPSPKLISSQATAYGRNGTLGVKVWVLKKI